MHSVQSDQCDETLCTLHTVCITVIGERLSTRQSEATMEAIVGRATPSSSIWELSDMVPGGDRVAKRHGFGLIH